MTAAEVRGLVVLADEPTKSTLPPGRDGKPIYWQRIRTLLLEDESIVYGCADCDYTADSPAYVRSHLRVHMQDGAARVSRRARRGAGSAKSLLAKLERLEGLARVEADRDRWKARAVKAERELATVRRIVKGTGS